MSAQLIFITDDDEPTTYRLDTGPHLNPRDSAMARALMQYVLDAWDFPQPTQGYLTSHTRPTGQLSATSDTTARNTKQKPSNGRTRGTA